MQAPRAICSATGPEMLFAALAPARSTPRWRTFSSSEYAVMPPRKNSEAPGMAPIRACSRPQVTLSATASESRGPRSMRPFRSLMGRSAGQRLGDLLQVRQPRVEVGADHPVHEEAEPAVHGTAPEVALHQIGRAS